MKKNNQKSASRLTFKKSTVTLLNERHLNQVKGGANNKNTNTARDTSITSQSLPNL